MISYPRVLRLVGGILSAALVVMVIIGWIALPAHLRALFTPSQVITLLAVLAALVGVIWLVAGSSVRADADGVTVRNGLRVRQFGWPLVRRVLFRPGDPWATLLVGDPEDPVRVQLFGIQRSDGDRAVNAVTQLRRLQAAARPVD